MSGKKGGQDEVVEEITGEEDEKDEAPEATKALSDIATKLWDLANRITAFSILYILATLFLLAKEEDFSKVLQSQSNATGAFAVTWAMGCGYIIAVYKCYESEIKARKKAQHPKVCIDTARLAMKGRIISIIVFTLLGIGAMLANFLKVHELFRH